MTVQLLHERAEVHDFGADEFRGLSRPAPGTRDFASRIVRTYATGVCSVALERVEKSEVVRYVADGLSRIDGLGIGWDSAFGALHNALADLGSVDEALIEVALHFAASGCEGSWSTHSRRRRWRFGNLLLPSTDELSLSVEPGIASITTDGSRRVEFAGSGLAWHPTQPKEVQNEGFETLEPLSFGSENCHAAVYSGELLPFENEVRPMLFKAEVPHGFAPAVADALSQIAEAAPAYVPWVRDVMRLAVPCRAKRDTLSSGSSSRMPGVLRITADPRPEAIVEMIVHESSHQYFYLAGLTGDVADPGDERLFWSPAKQQPRPIDRILLAYHAFANVEAVFAACLASEVGNVEYYRPQFERLVPQLDLMEEHLLGAGSLTELGKALAEPLIERRGRH